MAGMLGPDHDKAVRLIARYCRLSAAIIMAPAADHRQAERDKSQTIWLTLPSA